MRAPRMTRWIAAGCLTAAALIGTSAMAQTDRGPGDRERRVELEETIEIYMITKMKRYLELTDDQEKVMIPLIEELNNSRREMRQQRHLTMKQLRPLIEDDGTTEEQIERLLADLDAIERDMRETEAWSQEQIRETLSPRQQAQFRVFQERFHREIRSRMRRLERGGGPGGEGPGRDGRPDRRRPPR